MSFGLDLAERGYEHALDVAKVAQDCSSMQMKVGVRERSAVRYKLFTDEGSKCV